MSSQLTIDDVRDTINRISNGEAQLLSTVYVNNKEKLYIKCRCGEIFQRSYASARRSKLLCDKCSNSSKGNFVKKTLEQVKQRIAEDCCECLSEEYIDSCTKLKIKCSCGTIFEKSFRKFREGQNCCPECGIQKRRRFTPDEAKEIYAKYGYTLVDDYKAVSDKYLCLDKDGNECYVALKNLLNKKPKAETKPKPKPKPKSKSKSKPKPKVKAKPKNKAKSKPKVKPKSKPKTKPKVKSEPKPKPKAEPKPHKRSSTRHSEIGEVIRDKLETWTNRIRKKYHYCCPISQDTDVVVHHLVALNTIFKQCCKERGLKIKQSDVVDLNGNEELNDLIADVVERHTLDMGVLISKDIHKKFHSEYGYGNNTPDQFNEFLINHYNITLEDVRKG